MTGWLYNHGTDAWRRVKLVKRPFGYACRLDGKVLLFGAVADEHGAEYAAGDWVYHPRQVPPCRECGDVLAPPGQGHRVDDDICGECRPSTACDPAADYTETRIKLRSRGGS